MEKVRIYELAKELHQDSKTIINDLEKMNISVKNHMSSISQSVANEIKVKYATSGKKVEKPTAPKAAPVKKQPEPKTAAPAAKTAENAVTNQADKAPGAATVKAESEKPTTPAAKPARGSAEKTQKDAPRRKPATTKSNVEAAKPDRTTPQKATKASAEQKTEVRKAPASQKAAKPSSAETNDEQNIREKAPQKRRSGGDQARSGAQNKRKDGGGFTGKGGNRPTHHKKGKKKKGYREPAREQHEFVEVQHHVVFNQSITVQEIAHQMGKKASEIIMKLMSLGVMASINEELDVETATILAEEYGATIEVKASKEENLLAFQEEADAPEDLRKRAPVVTIMGHVDHGKTSLLDQIRKTNIISTEAGGITQQIGAYQVEVNGERITFVDTPGHEAFTSMRARGAQITDIAILVVAADDGVMPQTIEAIDHAKAAEVPIIVAINKIDKVDADAEKIKQELIQHGLISEEWGGDVIMVPVSAKKGTGIDELLEMILLVAEMADLKANPNRAAVGKVIESQLDRSRGTVATLLVQNGTLHNGDFLIAGTTQGRIRAMFDYNGVSCDEALPSMPVEILGLNDVPEAGDEFAVVANERLAKQVAENRQQEKHLQHISRGGKVSLEDLFNQIQEGNVRELNIVLKADTQGAIEAITQSLNGLGNEEVRVNVIRTAVGGIRETDVMLAAASQAIIIGFNVRPDTNAKRLADKESVDIKTYRIIYEALDDVKNALSGLLAPEIREVDLGQAEIRSIFKVPKIGSVAGCYVTDGKITRNAHIRVLRDSVVIHDGELASLKRFKDDVKEVATGYECGISLERFNDFKEGDVFEAYTYEEIKRAL